MRQISRRSLVFSMALSLASPFVRADDAKEKAAAVTSPLVERYLLDGKLAKGAKALDGRLKEAPKDDQARFGLGVLQFLQTFEHLGGGLYKYGLRTEKSFLRPPPQVKEFLPQNPNPETLTYAALRQIVQTFVETWSRPRRRWRRSKTRRSSCRCTLVSSRSIRSARASPSVPRSCSSGSRASVS